MYDLDGAAIGITQQVASIESELYNTGSETVSGTELKKIIAELMPNAEVSFNETGKPTPFIDDQNDQRIREELSFVPKSLKEGIKAHMNEARIANNLNPI